MTEWISVKDKLPQTGQIVVAWLQAHNEPCCVRFEKDYIWLELVEVDREDCFRVDRVTHWMPLPEPPNPTIFRERAGEFEGIPDECNL